MSSILVVCTFCKKHFYKDKNRYNEAIKFGWNLFCSNRCVGLHKQNQKIFLCSNPNCLKMFKRSFGKIALSGSYYCSRSCSVTVNNTKFPKRIAKIIQCLVCHKDFRGNKLFCSRKCKNIHQTVNRDEIITWINSFYQNNERIPFKKECPHEKAARVIFGSWNNAIKIAGFSSNPVLFSKKYIAKDGHKCDSLAEKIIDDWLTAKKIVHQIHVRYGGTKFTTDFLVNGTYVEFFGLEGQLKRYDKLMKEKLHLIANQKLKLISIYPADLFPKSRLGDIFADIS